MTAESYNLLNISDTPEKPYFFGMGMASRFNCNYGFENQLPHQFKKIANFTLSEELEQKLRVAGVDIRNGVPLQIQEAINENPNINVIELATIGQNLRLMVSNSGELKN